MSTVRLADVASRVNDNYHFTPARKEGTIIHVETAATYPNPPAPAWYEPTTGDIYIHLTEADIPLDASTATRSKFAGLVHHESSHTLHSGWLTSAQLNPKIRDEKGLLGTLTMLEELRIEKLAVDARPFVRSALRSSLDIILKSLELTGSPRSTAGAWILVCGRVFAGVADMGEVEEVDTAARSLLTDEVVDELGDLLQQAMEVRTPAGVEQTERTLAQMIEIAREVNALIPPDESTEEGETGTGCGHGDGEGEKKSGKLKPGKPEEEKPEGEDKAPVDKPEEAVETDDEDADAAASGGDEDEDLEDDESDEDEGDGGDHGYSEEDGDMMRRAIEKATEDIVSHPEKTGHVTSDPIEWANKVFGARSDRAHANSSWKKREPRAEERRAVTTLARKLETLTIPAITKQPVAKALPPGRLKTREAVRATAERAQGRMVTAAPWKATKRRHSHVKPLIIGLMTDTSGSMSWAQDGVATAAYVVSNAGARIGARTASVTFGNTAQPVTWPKQPAREVITRQANSGWEAFDFAAASLDGALKLSSTEASKLVIIVSDAMLVKDGELEKATIWCDRWARAGVQIVWIGAHAASLRTIAPTAVVAKTSRKGIPHNLEITDAIEEAIVKLGR
jgi:hypothetical protein